jgi:DNA-directed RNA polymerase specialized sigma24 family protein
MRAGGVRLVTSTDPSDPGDRGWVVEAAPGRGSFDAFYRAEVDRLYRALAVTLGDHHVAREAIDEAMVRACTRWRKIGGYDCPAGWVYRVGLNWARSRWRKLHREQRLEPPEDGDDTDGAAAPGPGPGRLEPEPDAGSVGGPALAALRRLPVEQRSVVVCRVLLDLDTAGTAAALGIPIGTAKSRLARGLAALRRQIEEEEDR